jgi:hypothetical protein
MGRHRLSMAAMVRDLTKIRDEFLPQPSDQLPNADQTSFTTDFKSEHKIIVQQLLNLHVHVGTNKGNDLSNISARQAYRTLLKNTDTRIKRLNLLKNLTTDEEKMCVFLQSEFDLVRYNRRPVRSIRRQRQTTRLNENNEVELIPPSTSQMNNDNQLASTLREMKDQHEQEQDKYLDMVGNSLTTLKQMALDIDASLTVHKVILTDVDTKIDRVQVKYDTLNTRVLTILEDRGGMSVICPAIIMMIIIIALVGYIFSKI